MKKIIFGLTILISLFLVTYLLVFFLKGRNRWDNVQPRQNSEHVSASILENQSENIWLRRSLMEERNKLRKSYPFILIRIKSTQCQSCFDYFLTDIKELIEYVGKERVLLCSWDLHPNDLKAFNSMLNFQMDTVLIKSLDIKVDNINQPFLMVLDPGGFISSCNIYRKDLPDLNYSVFDNIKRKLEYR
jgi:hypothetical protein